MTTAANDLRPPFPLEPYQEEAIFGSPEQPGILNCHDHHQSTLLVLPTGCGKTFTFSAWLQLRKALNCGRALVLAHRRELVDQATETLRRFGLSTEVEMAEREARATSMFALSDAVVASVATMQGKRLERWDPDSFGSIVVDEGHHATAHSYRRILKHFDRAKVLFVTATPDRADGVGLRNVCETVAYTYEIADAVRDGKLVRPVIKTVEVASLDVSQVKSNRGELSDKELETALTVDKVAHQMCAPMVELAGDRSTVMFLPTVAAAQQFAEVLGGYVPPERVAVVHGGTEQTVRERILTAYDRGEIQFILNCAVLTEGWDSPRTSCIALARPTLSRALQTQQVGRGLRVLRDPETGEIRPDLKDDCLILDFTGRAGKHRLVNPVDCLAGSKLTDKQKQIASRHSRAREALERGDLETVRAFARQLSEEEAAKNLAARQRRRVRAAVEYGTKDVDPFVRLADEGTASKTLAQLRDAGVPGHKIRDQNHAEHIAAELRRRKRQGLATYRQSRVLRRYGLTTEVSKKEATRILDAIAKNRWKLPPSIEAKYRK